MQLCRIAARGFRNLADLAVELPPRGVALLGPNAQGKTNLLEAIYYPVLFRSFRGAADGDLTQFGGAGFHLECVGQNGGASGTAIVTATYTAGLRRKRIVVDGEEIPRVADAVGSLLAVAFLPADVGLASGPASERRHYLDRQLSLADPAYLRSLVRYRAALAQRNSALRQDRLDMARAFDAPLAQAGARVMAARCRWACGAAEQFTREFDALGEGAPATLRYQSRAELADPEAWPVALDGALSRDRARRLSTVGPHRDDLALEIGGRPLREFGSTGQQRSAAVALKLIEIVALRAAHGTEPALLLDDVFAEFDGDRQERLAARLGDAARQVFVTAPRADELPASLDLPVWRVAGGRVAPVDAGR